MLTSRSVQCNRKLGCTVRTVVLKLHWPIPLLAGPFWAAGDIQDCLAPGPAKLGERGDVLPAVRIPCAPRDCDPEICDDELECRKSSLSMP